MNVCSAMRGYIDKMVSPIMGMKVILLDKETMGMISVAFTKSEILQKEVYLFERIDENRQEMRHLKAICYLRPTRENIQLLSQELNCPKYAEYHLFFSSTISSDFIKQLAHADEHQVVKQVQEYFADFYAINPDTFSLGIESSVVHSEDTQYLRRVCNGLQSILLAFRLKPTIRYEKKSTLCLRVAQELMKTVQQEKSLFDFRSSASCPPELLIIDRRSDPVTPLLTQWTYQAMVHELIGISNNRISLARAGGDPKEYILNAEHDEFYANNIYSNFGDLAINIKAMIQKLQQHSKQHKEIKSIADMKTFIEKYPEYQKLSGNVSKHIAILDEMSKQNTEEQLMPISEVEQELACNNDHSIALKGVTEILRDATVHKKHKIKIMLLYALRYEKHASNNISGLINLINTEQSQASAAKTKQLVETIISYGGDAVRSGDLFSNKSWIASVKSSIKKGMQGATNVYTQHKPMLYDLLDDLLRGKINETEYPVLMQNSTTSNAVPSNVIVFIVGGATYEEALNVHNFNSSNETTRIILGGSNIINSRSFFAELEKWATNRP